MSKTVMIFGTFDLLHPGHVFVFAEAMKRGEVTVVIARDSTVERIKGRAPKQTQAVRLEAIKTRFPLARAVLGDTDDFLSPIRAVNPDLILLGYDQQLPPRVTAADLPCPVERLPGFEPEKYKSSLKSFET